MGRHLKIFVNPLAWFFVLQLGVLVWLYFRHGSELSPIVRMVLSMLLCSLIGLIALSLPVTEAVLERSLVAMVNEEAKPPAPNYIFVLGGGFRLGNTPQDDFLNDACYQRVLTGAAFWREHPSATFVVSGTTIEYPMRSPERMAQLMVDAAESHGVPRAQMVTETHSINTREHPQEALKLPGVTPETPIAIVTSAWHMPRAKQEFSRYFTNVQTYSTAPVKNALDWQSFVPNASTLEGSTTYVREWVGMAWYAIVARVG